MATATTEAATSSIAEPKASSRKNGSAFPAPTRREGGGTVHRSILSDQDVGQRNGGAWSGSRFRERSDG